MVNFTYFGEGGRRGLWEGPKNEAETLVLVVSQVKGILCHSNCKKFRFPNFFVQLPLQAVLHLLWLPFQRPPLHRSQGGHVQCTPNVQCAPNPIGMT